MTKTRTKSSDVQVKFTAGVLAHGINVSDGESAGYERQCARWIPGLPGQDMLLEAMLRSKIGGSEAVCDPSAVW